MVIQDRCCVFSRANFLKRINHVRETAELATLLYINPNTRQPNVSGLILAGSVEYKTTQFVDIIDPLLNDKIVNVVDVSYVGENGFNQAIELSSEILSNFEFRHERYLIGKLLEEISQDTGKYVYGVDATLQALEAGAVERHLLSGKIWI